MFDPGRGNRKLRAQNQYYDLEPRGYSSVTEPHWADSVICVLPLSRKYSPPQKGNYIFDGQNTFAVLQVRLLPVPDGVQLVIPTVWHLLLTRPVRVMNYTGTSNGSKTILSDSRERPAKL